MKKVLMSLTGAVSMFGASVAATLPEWAVGSFKGQVENWCNDGFSVYGSASLNVANNGKVSGNIDFDDGASGKSSGEFKVLTVSDDEIRITAGFKWYDERGKSEGSSRGNITILRTSSDVSMEFEDNDDEEEDWDDKCPVVGTLTKTGSGSNTPVVWQKSRTLMGVATRALPPPYNVQGLFELKCGKANKQGIAKVSAAFMGLDGKKTSYKAQNIDVTGKTATVNFDGMVITIDGESFEGNEGLAGGLSVLSAKVGDKWTGRGATVTVDADNVSMFAGRVLEDFLPKDEQATVNNGKWSFAKAASVKWAKPKKGAPLPEIYEAASGKGLIVDTSKGKTNLSGLKLTYTPKKGTFKGTFKVYALEGEDGEKTKLKKYTVSLTGIVVDGVGYGVATCKKPAASWTVTVE